LSEDVFFLTGTDENAQKNVLAAEKEGISPKKFVDQNANFAKNLWKKFNISFDYFIRTTNKKDPLAWSEKALDKMQGGWRYL
jgi:methionyl-tRNA synthetase